MVLSSRKFIFEIAHASAHCFAEGNDGDCIQTNAYLDRAMKFLTLLAIAALSLTHAFADGVSVVEGPKIVATDTTASLTWKTDRSCGTRVRYGTVAERLDGRAGEGSGIDHKAEIAGLTPGTKYFYAVGTSRYDLSRGEFTTTSPVPVSKNPLRRLVDAITKPKPPVAATTTLPSKVAQREVPPTRKTWGNLSSLQDHFERHGPDFHATSPDDYARQAWQFLQRAMDEGLPAKQDDSDGSIRVYDPKTRAFAAYNRDGTTKTYFKPGSPDYFKRQPGRPITLKRPQ
jgi:hypothetical protein